MGLLNHVLLPCNFSGNPVPDPLPFGFTTTPGTTLIAAVAGPSIMDWSGHILNTFKTDAGDIFKIVDGSTTQAPASPAGDCGCTLHGSNIFWVPSGIGGATRIASVITDFSFDMWIYEVAGVTGVLDHGCADSGCTSNPPATGPTLNGGSGAFYVSACGASDNAQTVNSPWTLDMTDRGGLYMCFGNEFDYAAAYMTGSGIQTPVFSLSFVTNWSVTGAAFGLAGACGNMASPVVGNPLI